MKRQYFIGVFLIGTLVILGGCVKVNNNKDAQKNSNVQQKSVSVETTKKVENKVEFLPDKSIKYTWKGQEYCLPSNEEDCNTDDWKNGGMVLEYYDLEKNKQLKEINLSERYFFAVREQGYCGTDAYSKHTVLIDKETGKFLDISSNCSPVYDYSDDSVDPTSAEAEETKMYKHMYRVAKVSDTEIILDKFELGGDKNVKSGYFCQKLEPPISPLTPFDALEKFEKIGKKVEERKVVLDSVVWRDDKEVTEGTRIERVFGKQKCSGSQVEK